MYLCIVIINQLRITILEVNCDLDMVQINTCIENAVLSRTCVWIEIGHGFKMLPNMPRCET